jgi:hypothetical protein
MEYVSVPRARGRIANGLATPLRRGRPSHGRGGGLVHMLSGSGSGMDGRRNGRPA